MSNCNILIVYPLFLLLFLFIINVAPAQTFYNDLEDSTYSAPWINVQISDSGNARSGNHFSLNDGEIPYGLGIEMPFPDEVKNKNTVVKIEGWVENRGGPGQATFVISLDAKGKSWFWKGIDLSKILKENSIWLLKRKMRSYVVVEYGATELNQSTEQSIRQWHFGADLYWVFRDDWALTAGWRNIGNRDYNPMRGYDESRTQIGFRLSL